MKKKLQPFTEAHKYMISSWLGRIHCCTPIEEIKRKAAWQAKRWHVSEYDAVKYAEEVNKNHREVFSIFS